MDKNVDRILSSDQDVIPPSDFVRSVMAAVHREASTPAPISFPWWRVVPGLAVCGIALTALLVIALFNSIEASPLLVLYHPRL